MWMKTLFMGFPRITEATLKEIVAPESDEGLLLVRPVPRQGSLHRLGKPVVPDSAGHAAEEIEGLLMTLKQGLLLLVGGSYEKWYFGETQPSDKELHGDGAALHYHSGFAEVNLSVHTGLIGQRYEDRA